MAAIRDVMTIDQFIMGLSVKLNKDYTEEQKDLMKSMLDGIVFSNSLPGTGKTSTVIDGLHCLTNYYGVKPERINVMSFTNRATDEIKERYSESCKKLGSSVKPISFLTLDKMCSEICATYHTVVGMNSYRIADDKDLKEDIDFIVDAILEVAGKEIDKKDARTIYEAILNANQKFLYTDHDIVESSKYKACHNIITLDQFKLVRKDLQAKDKAVGLVKLGSIGLLAYEILLADDRICQYYKDLYDVMIVDEVQDMSTLQLLILNKIVNKMVAIGDVNQQIYGFRGASTDIMDTFADLFPEVIHRDLTHTFRCEQAIVDLARNIIVDNGTGGERLVTELGKGSVQFLEEPSTKLADSLCKMYREDGDKLLNKKLVIYRNRFSAITLIDQLYKEAVPVRTSGFTKIFEMPVIGEIFDLITLIKDPINPTNFQILSTFLPELRNYQVYNFVTSEIRKKKKSIIQLNFGFREQDKADRLFDAWFEVEDMLSREDSHDMFKIYTILLEVLWENSLKREIYYKNYSMDLINLAAEVAMKGKTYKEFVAYERAKFDKITSNYSKGVGIECLTMHAAKGTEADEVYILDADNDIVPSRKHLTALYKKKCITEFASAVKGERSLLYVAVTRAKSKLVIQYNKEKSNLLEYPNKFTDIDLIENISSPLERTEAFLSFIKG